MFSVVALSNLRVAVAALVLVGVLEVRLGSADLDANNRTFLGDCFERVLEIEFSFLFGGRLRERYCVARLLFIGVVVLRFFRPTKNRCFFAPN